MLLPLVVPLTGLLLHRDHLWGQQRCRLPVAGFKVLPKLPVEVGQLLVELTSSFCELIETHPSLGVGGAVTWHWLWWSCSKPTPHTRSIHTRGRVAAPSVPLGRRRARGGAGRS
jgi:hypothetical protein